MDKLSELNKTFKGNSRDFRKKSLKELGDSSEIQKYLKEYLSKQKRLEGNKENKLDLDSCLQRYGVDFKRVCRNLNLDWDQTCAELNIDPKRETRHNAFYDTVMELGLIQELYEKASQAGSTAKQKNPKRKLIFN